LRKRIIASLLVALVMIGAWAVPAGAAPGDPTAAPDEGTANMTLGELLDKANSDFLDAQGILEVSKKHQAELNTQIVGMQRELDAILAEVNLIAGAAYRTGGVRTAAALLHSQSTEAFIERTMMVNTIARYNDRQLGRLTKLQAELAAAKKAVDAEVAQQQAQTDVMAKKKKDAETALVKMGGRANGYVNANSPLATPAPRNANGSWPKENCIIDDPTTSGCVTPRTIHAAREAQKAGFTRYYSCYRPSGPYEHPKGRACDFAASANGFGGVATGGDKTYGGNLAAFFVRNASALGVLYVIWFRQVWTPATGWHSYSGGNGDPSSDHTNHVHLSMY
jgi:peptidoglycan DL-endopeptidase CwlO